MDVLKQIFSEKEMEVLFEDNPYIKKQSNENIRRILSILSNQKCSNNTIRNIVGRNTDVLLRDPDSIEELIYKLKEYNIIHLDKVFDKYPEILNRDFYDVDRYFFIKQKEGLSVEEIAKKLENDPKEIDMTNK